MVSAVVMAMVLGHFAGIPPLSDQHKQEVAQAIDDHDHREQAFLALIEHVQGWPANGEIGDAAIRVRPDLDGMMADPDRYRGDLCRVAGRVEQITPLPPPYERAAEWFVRDSSQRPFIVYVIDRARADSIQAGQHVEVVARFYKVVEFMARDGQARRYAAFVGAHPRIIAGSKPGGPTNHVPRLWMIAGPVAAMLIIFVSLRLFMRKQHRQSRAHRLAFALPPMDEPADLPDDPADALAELRRRSLNETTDAHG